MTVSLGNRDFEKDGWQHTNEVLGLGLGLVFGLLRLPWTVESKHYSGNLIRIPTREWVLHDEVVRW